MRASAASTSTGGCSRAPSRPGGISGCVCGCTCNSSRKLPAGYVANLGIGWRPQSDEYGPDLIVYRLADHDERASRFTGLPLLAVEVLSPNAGRELVVKPVRYARAGLPQYWVVHPDGFVDILDLDSQGEGVFRARLRLTDTAQKVTLAGRTQVTIDPTALFAA